MQSYEAIARRAARACEAPMGTLAILEHGRLVFAANYGRTRTEDNALIASLLRQTCEAEGVFVAEDVCGQYIRAFAAVALFGSDGSLVGALGVADHRPGSFSQDHVAALRDFGTIASALVLSRREFALRRLMSRAVEEAADFVMITDASVPSKGGPFIEYVNPSLLHALGYTADELDGQPYQILFAATNDAATLRSIAQNLEQSKDNEKEVQLRRKDGTPFWVEFIGRPLIGADGTPSHWFAVGRDISRNRDANAQIAALINAIDSVSDHVEIYSLEGDRYSLAFQNAAADPVAVALVDKLLNAATLDAEITRECLRAGEELSLAWKGLYLRSIDADATTLICVRQPRRIAAAS